MKLSTEVYNASVDSKSDNPKAIGNFVFNEATIVWKRVSPKPHAAARVRVEIEETLSKTEMRKAIQAWSFLDSGAQVGMILPNIVEQALRCLPKGWACPPPPVLKY